MFQKCSSGATAISLVISLAALLSACSGGGDGSELAQPSPQAPAMAAMSAPLAAPAAAAPMAQQDASAVQVTARMEAKLPTVLKGDPRVTESERVAEQLRLVDFEQSYSIEMNRRAQEQAEREQRAAVNARAGIVQGPGCEGTEGHAALECERSISQG